MNGLADALRIYNAILAFGLVVLIATSPRFPYWGDHWARVAYIGILLVVGAGSASRLGEPLNWRMPILAAALTVGVVSSLGIRSRRRDTS
jgi:hypothetical protein